MTVSCSKIKYEHLIMATYLHEEIGYSVGEKLNIFQYKMKNLDVKADRRWKYDNLTCISCNNLTQI